jgi:hypothetical protein
MSAAPASVVPTFDVPVRLLGRVKVLASAVFVLAVLLLLSELAPDGAFAQKRQPSNPHITQASGSLLSSDSCLGFSCSWEHWDFDDRHGNHEYSCIQGERCVRRFSAARTTSTVQPRIADRVTASSISSR